MPSKKHTPYSLNSSGSFVIEDYNHTKPFSNFFPGIAGRWGIPMWVFYVNRGQCVTSFGIESKDKSILEFQPANKAYRLTSLQGFRTFLKIKSGAKTLFWEPFQSRNGGPFRCRQSLSITSHDLTIKDINLTLGVCVEVNYFTLPQEPFAGLIRRVTVSNVSKKKYKIAMIDGLPAIMPFGLKDGLVKNISRTVEAWVKVRNLEKKAPYYHLDVEVADNPVVTHIREGNFYFAFEPSGAKAKLLTPIVEAQCVFGASCDFMVPETFIAQNRFQVPKEQHTTNRTPSAMSLVNFDLNKGAAKEIVSMLGYAHDLGQLNKIVAKATAKNYIKKKEEEHKNIINAIRRLAYCESSSPAFDLYTAQTFLDNVLRGGIPTSLKTKEGNVAFNIFSRKHGDLERDYNFFLLTPTYFSQGNGNYRDVNQNRRNDVWFNRDVKSNGLLNFLNLVQMDGYNPLVVEGMRFFLKSANGIDKVLKDCVENESRPGVAAFVKNDFLPGDLLKYVTQNGTRLKVSEKQFLGRVLDLCGRHELAVHGEGFWTDHWTYNLDLLESFLAVYPDQLDDLLLNQKVFSFYQNAHYVLPRDQRYVLTDRGVRQYYAVAKNEKESNYGPGEHKLKTRKGEGAEYHTHLVAKLLCIIANKAASLDPSGIGIEMEAGKPNWYDALNGLPGLLGSSVSETFELKRACIFLLDALDKFSLNDDTELEVFEELGTFIDGLNNLLAIEPEPMAYWSKANDIKEHYRHRVRDGIEGQEVKVSLAEIKKFLNMVIRRTDKAVQAARDKNGLLTTYFYHEVTEHQVIDKRPGSKMPFVRPKRFRCHRLPLFLEGFVHALRVEENQHKARALYRAVRQSPLFDKKLKMYKVNTDLAKETEEIGRCRIFPPGWLENESIWLHMEYKFILELLRNGLYEEFYENFKNILIPFLDPKQYGRSILENSSFIVSTAHKDADLHGQGFVARLSGSTAEFTHMWLMMNAGNTPFTVDAKGELCLTFKPALPGWLFTKEGTYSFHFMGTTLVVYHNPKRRDTFGPKRAKVKHLILKGPRPIKIASPTIPAPHAKHVRDGKIEQIDIFLE